MLRALLAAVAPPACVACRRPSAPGDPLCRGCRLALPWLGPGTCPRCALPRPCGGACAAGGQVLDAAWAPLAYDGPVPAVVRAFKERGALPLAGLMAAQIAAAAPPALPHGAVLVPVPADQLRRRRRGVDHTALLAAELAARWDVPVARALRRPLSRTSRQAGAGRSERLADGRVRVEAVGTRTPAVALLVDDVHTTGATLRACAAALRSVGSREVRAATYARALPSSGIGSTV